MEEPGNLEWMRVPSRECVLQVVQVVWPHPRHRECPALLQMRRHFGPHAAHGLREKRRAVIVRLEASFIVPHHQDDRDAPGIPGFGAARFAAVKPREEHLQGGFRGQAARLEVQYAVQDVHGP